MPLQHGDRVMMEHLKPAVPEEHPPDVVMSEMKAQGESSASSGSAAETKANQQRQGVCVCMHTRQLFYYRMLTPILQMEVGCRGARGLVPPTQTQVYCR